RRKKLAALAICVLVPAVAHGVVAGTTRITPPPVAPAVGEPAASSADPDLRVLGRAYARHRGKIIEARLVGGPEETGHQHGRLLIGGWLENEGTLSPHFDPYVPFAPARWLIMAIPRLQFRRVDHAMPDERRREIASAAAAFTPDPYAGFLPTYHRFVFLQSL